MHSNPLAPCRYRQAEDLIAREIAGEMLLVPIRNNVGDLESIYTLNETGAFIWSMMDGDNTLDAIHTALTAEFDVTTEEAWTDLIEFVDGLKSIQALIEVN